MLPPLYVISDSSQTDNITTTLKQCLDMGVTWVGIREYNMDISDLLHLTEDIITYAEPMGAMVSIWGYPDIATKYAIGCHTNIHTYTPHIKNTLNWDSPLGVSTHTESDISTAKGADYITLSPIFNSISKQGYKGMGTDTFSRICQTAPMPVFALGGITQHTAKLVFETGAYGFCICGQAMQSPQSLKQILNLI